MKRLLNPPLYCYSDHAAIILTLLFSQIFAEKIIASGALLWTLLFALCFVIN
jgi:hypothetical protein